MGELCSEYHLEPEVAFFICRPAIAHMESQAAEAAKAKDNKDGKDKGAPADAANGDADGSAAASPGGSTKAEADELERQRSKASKLAKGAGGVFVDKSEYEEMKRRIEHLEAQNARLREAKKAEQRAKKKPDQQAVSKSSGGGPAPTPAKGVEMDSLGAYLRWTRSGSI